MNAEQKAISAPRHRRAIEIGKLGRRREEILARGPHKDYPICTALIRWWEHMEKVHGATQDDYGTNALKWHRVNHPECKTLPSYDEAKRV